MNVDFSKAPDWATGHGLMVTGFGIEEVWFDSNQYLPVHGDPRFGPYPYGGGDGEHRHNSTRKAIRFHTLKPEPWTGKGLPPVGIEIEAFMRRNMHDDYAWHRAKVVHGALPDSPGEVLVFGLETTSPAWVDEFRPIRTPEQIAEEARIAELNLMVGAIKDYPAGRHGVDHLTQLRIHEEVCIDLYGAGWRRQVTS